MRRRRDARVVETAWARTHFREVVIARRSKHSPFASAVTSEPRGSIMPRRAASTASRAASRVLSRWRTLDAVDAASSLGGRRANVPRPPPGTPGLSALQRCGLGGDRAPLYAIDATPHKFRQQPELRPSGPRCAYSTRPLRLRVRILQPRPVIRRSERFRGRTRTHACFGWGSREARRPRARELFLIRQP